MMNLFDVYPLLDVELVKGKGAYLYATDGSRYLDFYGGHAVISVGHTHPIFTESVRKQLETLPFYSNAVHNRQQKELAQKLGYLSNYNDYALFLVNSGAEANENALKLASFQNGRKKIVAFKGAFHGRTSAAVKVTDNPKIIAPINDGLDVEFVVLNDILGVKKRLERRDVAAVIIEGIQGVGGIQIPNKVFLQEVQKMCNTTGTVLILDEIQSGYGRSGRFFAHQYAKITPDIITTAKGMGNGIPIGGVLIAPHFKASYGLLGTTFGGNHLACAAGIAVLDIIESENLLHNTLEMGNYLMEEIHKMPHIKEVRGRGLMIGVEMDRPVKEVRETLLYSEKTFTGVSGTHTIRLLPPLNITTKEVNLFLENFKTVLSRIQ